MYTVTAAPSGSRTLGANLFDDRSGASFVVWAPHAGAVTLRLTPTNVQPFPFETFALSPDPAQPGYWSVDVSGVAAGHLYQYEITNRGGDTYDPGGLPLLRVDPCARQVISSDRRMPAAVADPTFTFTTPFRTPPFEDFILYQAHVGSFAGRNDPPLQAVYDPNGGTASFDLVPDVLRGRHGRRHYRRGP